MSASLGDVCQVSSTDVGRMWCIRFLHATRFQQHAVGDMGGVRHSRLGITLTCCRRNRAEGLSHLPHTPLVPNAIRRVSLGRRNESIICMSRTGSCSPAQSSSGRCATDERSTKLTRNSRCEDDDECELCATPAVQRDQRRFSTHGVQIEQTLQHDCHAPTHPCHGSAHCLVGHLCTPAADTQRLVGLEASRHVTSVFRSSQVAENWLGCCWWHRVLSLDGVAERILTSAASSANRQS